MVGQLIQGQAELDAFPQLGVLLGGPGVALGDGGSGRSGDWGLSGHRPIVSRPVILVLAPRRNAVDGSCNTTKRRLANRHGCRGSLVKTLERSQHHRLVDRWPERWQRLLQEPGITR